MELLPFVDILKVFNNPINEEQAWAVCFQCANFLGRNPSQEFYQVVYDFGINSIWLNRHGDVLLRKGPSDPNGSGKGPPQSHGSHHSSSSSASSTILSKGKGHVIATETDAVQALGTAIFEALDFGIDESEERQLSHGLESLIVTMTNTDNSMEYEAESQNADDEGIEKDADVEHRCNVQDVLKLCGQHLSSKQDAHHHYKAVCRALATEAGELFTFLDKISSSKEKLSVAEDEDSKRLTELQRADWACLWVQVMRSLRQGVRLKKVEHINLPPVEYELTPFEMLLEDIRSRRYTLHKIMVNGEIPHKVKDNAHAVILDFIRSRPPLKKVNERKLKPKPPSPPDPHEQLLKDIRSRPKLRPIKHGKLVVETSRSRLNSDDDQEQPLPAKRVIKPDFDLLLNNSFEESSDDDDHHSLTSSPMSHFSSPGGNTIPPSTASWQRAVTKDTLMREPNNSHRPTKLQRRHTIMVCESPVDGKVPLQELPPLEEEEEPSPVRESHHLFHQPVSQPQGHPMLPRTSYSEHDLPSQVTLRNQQGNARRSSLEHRRSLTSLPTGLCAIPEADDNPSGSDSPSAPNPVRRSWSHEQAPPPNPSPPCKGRARAALGMGMAGMKSVGGPYHPATHRQHHTPLSSPLTLHNQSANSGMTPEYTNFPVSNSLSHSSVQSKYKHAPVNYSTSSAWSSSSSSSSSVSSAQHAQLDQATSSQSPVYFKNIRTSQGASTQNGANSSGSERRVQRWRHAGAREERMNHTGQGKAGGVLVGRRGNVNKLDEQFDTALPVSVNQSLEISEDEARARRLSLESGASLYIDGKNTVSGLESADGENKAFRRSSLGMQNGGRGRNYGRRKVKSPEEEERVTRWRTLQEEEIASRTRRVGRDMTSPQTTRDEVVQPQHQPQQTERQQQGWANSRTAQPSEETDVLQQKMADEEARFTRWRRLEEAGGRDFHSEDDSGHFSPSNDKEYVSAALCARLQSPASPKTVAASTSSTSHTSLHEVSALPKRWQNPVECLSLTLEEVTHIRSVLTKAELESLISHPDLYQHVSKNKICFTCKTTRFTLFGEWGTKCKFCKRTVCSKCLRKMNVPTDHFRNIPVYTLSPTPLTTEMEDFIQNVIRAAPSPTVPPSRDISPNRVPTARSLAAPLAEVEEDKQQPTSQPSPTSEPLEDTTKLTASKGFFAKSKQLQRSQSLQVPKTTQAAQRVIKGPMMAICCDCKGMVMEIIRASRTSLAMLSASSSKSSKLPTHQSPVATNSAKSTPIS